MVVSNLPVHVHIEDLEPLLTPFGGAHNCEKIAARDAHTQAVQITFESHELALQYVSRPAW